MIIRETQTEQNMPPLIDCLNESHINKPFFLFLSLFPINGKTINAFQTSRFKNFRNEMKN